MKNILPAILGLLTGFFIVIGIDSLPPEQPRVDLPEEYKAMEAGDLLKCDSVVNGKIYLSYANPI